MGVSEAIRIERLTYAYPDGTAALADLDLRIDAGESVALVGPNGAGKTTLFLCLAGVLTPFNGAVHVGALDVSDPAQRRLLPQHLGIVFQDSEDQLFHTTVTDDVAFGPRNLRLAEGDVQSRVAEALAQVGLTELARRVPYHLSGGEKRRVALAGVLAMRPEVLLLDEPSSHLDPRGRRELIELTNRLPNTKLIASHDLEFILATCRRAVVLDRGRLIADGPAASVFTNRSLMEAHGLEVPHSLTHAHPHT